MKRFHAHVTLANDIDRAPRGWKKTEIVLLGGKPQTESMITTHYSFPDDIPNALAAVLFDCEGIKVMHDVLRIKIEKNDNFLPITHTNYLECHCKICGPCDLGPSWIRSKNPKHVDERGEVYFWNRRIREEMSFAAGVRIVVKELAEACPNILETKIEQNVYDSNVERDLWWEKNEACK